MHTNSSSNGHATARAWLTVALALLAGLPACGDLDETDSDPPSVTALASWDSSHLVAVRTYHPDPVIVDVQSGKQTGVLTSSKYYNDIATIGNGEFICLHNQSIDFFRSDGTLDDTRSIPGPLFTGMAVSADRSTLAYASAPDSVDSSIGIADLATGYKYFPSPDISFNPGTSLSISRDGKLVAFAQGDVGVATTHPPDVTSTCVLELDPRHPGGPIATAFSPVEDKLAVSKVDGGVNIFDLSQFPACTLLSSFFSPEDNAPSIQHLQFSPDGSVVAISVETIDQSATTGSVLMTGVIKLLDATTGAELKEWPIYAWETMSLAASSGGTLITDLQWSDSGDRLAVSTSEGPVQQWDVASGVLLWSANL